jgi:hypothetical protein
MKVKHEDKRPYLYKSGNDVLNLDYYLKGMWANKDETDNYTLISEKKRAFYGEFKEADIWEQWYFYQGAQHYNEGTLHEHYGYKPFREANPDLHDIVGSEGSKYDKYCKIDDTEFAKAHKEQYKLYDDIDDRKEGDKGASCRKAFEKYKLMAKEYNMKTRGWTSCRTYFHYFYFIEVDKYDNSLLSYPFSINLETINMLLDKAPFLHKFSEFGLLAGKNNDKINWVSKDMLPKKAYKK